MANVDTNFILLKKNNKNMYSTKRFTENDIIEMLDFFLLTIYLLFGGRVCKQTVCNPRDTKCAPLLADLFLYSYEVDFIQGLLMKNEKKLS
jgi:hypothetical protein